MSLPRYPEYKDSGVEWLGDVPAHWQLAKIRSFTRFRGGGTPSRDNPSYWNGDIPWVSPKDMKVERIACAAECITEKGLRASTSSMVDAGSLLIVVRSGILKHTIPVAINEVPVALNQDMKALSFDRNFATSEFLMRWVQGLNELLLLAWAKQGATVESIEHAYLAETVVPLPSREEQAQITTFLGRETARIDALIAEQEKLLALLAEKRQATISHAVTRGLDPNVPMKDSGIAWLGEVPAHWSVSRFKASIASAKNGVWGGDAMGDANDIPCVRVADFDRRELTAGKDVPTLRNVTESERQGRLLKNGDLLLEKSGGGESQPVGQVVLYVGEAPAVCSNFVARVELMPGMDSRYWRFVHAAAYASRINVRSIKQTSGIQNLDQGQYFDEPAPFPPPDEQVLIADFLDQRTLLFDVLEDKVRKAIQLLQERRSALISAAVTGQIDVRGLVEMEAA